MGLHTDRVQEPPARFTCDGLPTATRSGSNHSALPHFPSSRISWLTAAPSIRSSKLEATSWLEQDPPLKRIRCQYQSMMRISRWKQPPVSGAVPVWRHAQIPPRCCSFRPKSRTLLFCRKAKRNVTAELFGWFGGWMSSVSEIAETTTNVKQFAPLK